MSTCENRKNIFMSGGNTYAKKNLTLTGTYLFLLGFFSENV